MSIAKGPALICRATPVVDGPLRDPPAAVRELCDTSPRSPSPSAWHHKTPGSGDLFGIHRIYLSPFPLGPETILLGNCSLAALLDRERSANRHESGQTDVRKTHLVRIAVRTADLGPTYT